MLFYLFYSLLLLNTLQFSVIIPNNNSSQNDLINLPKIPHDFYFYDLTKITFKKNAYQDVINKWQSIISLGYKKLFDQLYKEVGLTPEIFFQYLSNPRINSEYHLLKHANIVLQSFYEYQYIHEEEMDPEVLHFIRSTIFKYTSKRNVKIILTNQFSTLTATYGSDKYEYYVFCNSSLYTKNNIDKYYDSLQSSRSEYCITSNNNNIRFIEYSALLQLGLIESAAYIENQSDLKFFLLNNYTFQDKKVSKSSIDLYFNILEAQTLISAILQSKNPLEVSVFLMKLKEYNKLWLHLVKDIAKAYSELSLKKYKQIAREMKQIKIT